MPAAFSRSRAAGALPGSPATRREAGAPSISVSTRVPTGRFKSAGPVALAMAPEEALDELDERLLAYVKAYDFEKYPWNTEEAAAELGVPTTRVYQSLSKLQKVKKRELFVYYRDGALHIQTE